MFSTKNPLRQIIAGAESNCKVRQFFLNDQEKFFMQMKSGKNKTGNFSCEKFPVHLQRSPVSVSSYCYYDWILFSGPPEKLCFPIPVLEIVSNLLQLLIS